MELQGIVADIYRPSLKPSLKQQPRMVRITDEDYMAMAGEIYDQSEGKAEAYFEIEYEVDVYTLTVCGTIYRTWESNGGDGWFTPKEMDEECRIEVEIYECRDDNGTLVKSDFNPKYL